MLSKLLLVAAMEMGSPEAAARLITAAGRAAAIEEQRRAEEKARVEAAAEPAPVPVASEERT